jgi:hypothetical protein
MEIARIVMHVQEGNMAGHKVYFAIVDAVKTGRLKEPFYKDDFKIACPDLGHGTYEAFLYKHRLDNPGGNSELFVQVGMGYFRLLYPLKYR